MFQHLFSFGGSTHAKKIKQHLFLHLFCFILHMRTALEVDVKFHRQVEATRLPFTDQGKIWR